MTRTKRILESVISVLLILGMIASLIPLSAYSVRDGIDKDNIMGLYAENENSLDVVCVGGSACFVYWEALRAWKNYGYTSYSFAACAVTPQSVECCIKEAQKTQSPKLWVIDLRPFQYGDEKTDYGDDSLFMYADASIRNVTDYLKQSPERTELIDKSVLDPFDRIYYYFPFLRYHSKLVTNLIDDGIDLIRGTSDIGDPDRFKNRLKGFYFVPKTEPVDFTDYSDVTEEKPLKGEINEIFIDLLEFCKTEQITPLFVVHSYRQEEEHKQKYNYMKRMIESYGFDFLNTNDHYEEIGLDYSFDLYDHNHVNVYGAEKYTDFLAAYIKDNYELPDHRNEPEYSEWDECSDEFFIKVEETKKEILEYQKNGGDE